MFRRHRGAKVLLVLGVLFASATFAPTLVFAALIGHWTLDAGTINWGTGVVSDSSGNGNNGTVFNLTSGSATDGQVNGGVQFNGTNSYISIPVNGTFPVSGNGSRTVCMWFKPTEASWTPNDNSIFEYGQENASFGVDMHTFPEIEFYTWQNDLTVAMGIEGQEEDWLQICWVWDGPAKANRLYSNGELRGSQTYGSDINTAQTAVNIGRSALTSGYFPGIIDDVRMYNTALTGDDIEALYVEATSLNAETFSPLDNATSVSVSTNLTLTFGTTTAATSTGSIGLYTTSGNTLVESFAMSSGRMSRSATVASTTFTIDPTSSLSEGTEYYVWIPGTAFKDATNTFYAGTTASTTWSFTTGDFSTPEISAVAANVTGSTAATVTWTTSENASTRGAYGFTSTYTAYSSETDTSPRVTSHSISISSLIPCTTYHYAVISRDAGGNAATSSDATFTTTGCDVDVTPNSATSTTITSATGGSTAATDDNKTFTVTAPAGVTDDASSFVIQVKALPSDTVLSSIGRPSSKPNEVGVTVFDVKAIINGTTVLESFDAAITIEYEYADDEIAGLDESTLQLYHYSGGTWSALSSCSVNTSANTISCTTPSFSIFGLFGNSASSGGGGGYIPKSKVVVTTAACPRYTFARRLQQGSTGEDVRALQKFLNCAGFVVAGSGPGSLGKETTIFADRTRAAVTKFQEKYFTEVLAPGGFKKGTGIFATYSQKKALSLMGSQ